MRRKVELFQRTNTAVTLVLTGPDWAPTPYLEFFPPRNTVTYYCDGVFITTTSVRTALRNGA